MLNNPNPNRAVRSRLRAVHSRRGVDENWSKEMWRDYIRLLQWQSDFLAEKERERRQRAQKDNTQEYVIELRELLGMQS